MGKSVPLTSMWCRGLEWVKPYLYSLICPHGVDRKNLKFLWHPVCIYNIKETKVLFSLTFTGPLHVSPMLPVMWCNLAFIPTYHTTLYDQLEVLFSKLNAQNTTLILTKLILKIFDRSSWAGISMSQGLSNADIFEHRVFSHQRTHNHDLCPSDNSLTSIWLE